jgi:hypothetical protein
VTSLYSCPPSTSGAYGQVTTGTTAPSAPGLNDLWFDANLNVWKIWDGTSWNTVPGSGGGSGTGLPPASKMGQILVSQGGPGFPWVAEDGVDAGNW